MRLCPNGHQIPEYANGYCARCAQDERRKGKRSKSKSSKLERYLGRGGRSSDSYPPAPTELPPDKKMPTFMRGTKQNAGRQTKAKPARQSPAPKPVAKPKAAEVKSTPTFSPQRVLEGIEELIDLVSEKEMTLELLLARAAVPPQKMALFRNGRHAFVRDVRERWFSLFKALLLREEARVIVRKVGLDGLTRPKSMNELAERCEMSVEEMRRHGGNGLRKLREFTNRHAVMAAVTDSARLLLR